MKRNFGLLRKKIADVTNDFVLSILASVIYTFARQIVIFPLLASRMPDDDYGTLLTIVSLINVCTALVGGTLNNIRLIQNEKYEETCLKGDFLPLCAIGSLLSVAWSIGLGIVFGCSKITVVFLCAYVVINNYYQYATAFYRLNLDFVRNLIVNVVISVAYIPAALLFATKDLWPLVFLVGDGVGLIYVWFTTEFWKEPFMLTPLMKETSSKTLALVATSLVANLLMYADRMIIYPLLGGESVSYYSTASFFGKSAGIVMVPISGVLLGHFSQKGFRPSKKLFTIINTLSGFSLMVFLGGCWLFAPWFTQLLYPTLYAQSEPYIMLANIGAVISIAGNMAQPMILKCCSTKWLLFVQTAYGGVYVVASALLLPTYGLFGFCWVTIIANSVRLLMLYAIGYWKL